MSESPATSLGRLQAILQGANWKQAVKTGIAAGLCLWLTRLLGLRQGYWAAISTVVVMQSETAATVIASRDRLVGTAIGAVLGWAAAGLWHGHAAVYAATILLCLLLPAALGFHNAGRLAGVAASIIMLVPSALPRWIMACDRFLEVSFGIIIALLVAYPGWSELIPRRSAAANK